MAFEHWYNLNEHRAYPCHDLATLVADNGERLPDNIIVDANIWVPEAAGRWVFISSVTVTDHLVSVTFLGSTQDPFSAEYTPPTAFTPIASLSVVRPVLYRNYDLTAQYPGVAGWVTFGSGAVSYKCALRFSDPAATRLCGRASRSYNKLPIEAIKKEVGYELTGIVRLRGSGDIWVRSGKRVINGVEQDVILVGLDTRKGQDILQKYLGPCDGRPESRTCGRPPIMYINNVPPDCDGNININFSGILGSSSPSADLCESTTHHGIVLETRGFGVSDICRKTLGYIEPGDFCDSTRPHTVIDFTIPSDSDNDPLHFHIQFSKSPSFSSILEEFDSSIDQTNWAYKDDDENWVALTEGGVPPDAYGHSGRFTYAGTVLNPNTLYYYRLRAFDGVEYSEWAVGLIYTRSIC